MMRCFEETLRVITDSIRSIRQEEFDALAQDCLDVLARGGKIVASGLGKNVPICEKFVGTLNSVGVPAAFMHTNSAVHGDLGMVGEGDLVIVLTKSGETSESVYLARLLEQRGCGIWLLSFSRESSLCRCLKNKVILDLEHEGDEWNVLPNNSTVLNLIVLQELAMRLVKSRKVPLDVLRRNHPGGDIGARLSGMAK